jgi:hypothetical protein
MASSRKTKEIHAMMATTIRVIDKPFKLDDLEHRRVLKTLRVMYEGGSLDGKTANFHTRDVSRVVVGVHPGRNRHLFETYKRTISIDIRSRRTIFRCASLTVQPNDSTWWKERLALLRIRKLKAIVI